MIEEKEKWLAEIAVWHPETIKHLRNHMERVCVERERAAFIDCMRWMMGLRNGQATLSEVQDEAARRYPLPKEGERRKKEGRMA